MVVRRLGVVSVGKVFGAIYALLGLILGLFFALFSLLGAAIGASQEGAEGAIFGIVFGVFSVVLWPLFYGVLGFFGGLISAALYNLVARFIGGIEVEVEQRRVGAAPLP